MVTYPMNASRIDLEAFGVPPAVWDQISFLESQVFAGFLQRGLVKQKCPPLRWELLWS